MLPRHKCRLQRTAAHGLGVRRRCREHAYRNRKPQQTLTQDSIHGLFSLLDALKGRPEWPTAQGEQDEYLEVELAKQ